LPLDVNSRRQPWDYSPYFVDLSIYTPYRCGTPSLVGFMSKENFEHFASAAPLEHSASLSASMFSSDNAFAWRSIARPTDSTAGPTPSFADATTWPQIQPILNSAKSVEMVGSDHDPSVVPDFILGADGKLTANPAKKEPSPDGKITIEVQGAKQSEIAAAKLNNENQKASAREMISYFQKNNPGAQVPAYLQAILEKQPDLPSGGQDPPQTRPQTQPEVQPQPTQSSGGGGGGGSRGGGGDGGGGGGYRGGGGGEKSFNPSEAPPANYHPQNAPPIAGDMRVDGPATITPEKIDQVLKDANSPAAVPGMGQYICDLGQKYNINPAVALAFFVQESSAGTAGVARETHSWGNIVGEGPAGQVGRFRAYHDYKEGVADWFRLIHDKYLAPPEKGGFGCQTLSQIISHYAPSSDGNNERGYVANVKGMVTKWASDTHSDTKQA
jgi:uncharacterized membrane protein YgcG